jgi:hypothetical protein
VDVELVQARHGTIVRKFNLELHLVAGDRLLAYAAGSPNAGAAPGGVRSPGWELPAPDAGLSLGGSLRLAYGSWRIGGEDQASARRPDARVASIEHGPSGRQSKSRPPRAPERVDLGLLPRTPGPFDALVHRVDENDHIDWLVHTSSAPAANAPPQGHSRGFRSPSRSARRAGVRARESA